MKKFINNTANRIINALSAWHVAHADDDYFFYVIAVVLGVCCGIAAAMLKGGITWVMDTLFGTLSLKEGNWVFLLLPVAGIMLATMFMHYIVRLPMDHATERVAGDLAQDKPILKPRLIFGSIVACSITLGMGGSAGAESPIAYTGAAIGSNIGQAFKLNAQRIAALVGCGAAAGIGGIYMAPIGGVMFALEVLKMRQDLQTALGLTFASLASALTCYLLMGCHNDVTFMPKMLFDNSLIPYVLLFGVICGIYSAYYRISLQKCKRWLSHINNIWIKALSGGLLLSAMLYIFPSLYGEGYSIMGKLMALEPDSIVSYSPLYALSKHYVILLLLFVGLLLLKPLATSATNDSGGTGGDFTPTLFCGAALGYLFAGALNHAFGLTLSYDLFVFFGMAAVMSGAKKAPLMAIFITAEMTGLYGFILPLTLVALSSFVTIWFLHSLVSRNTTTAAGNQ